MKFVIILALAVSAHAQYAWFTTGEQRTIVAVIGGSSTDAARLIFFGATGSVDHFVREASHGQAWLAGDVVAAGGFSGDCSQLWGAFKDAADASVARVANLDLYTRRVYILTNSNCSFIGSSTIGITYRSPGGTLYSQTWLNGFPNAQVIRHEYFHGMGLKHAHTYQPRIDTGDPADVMGGGGHTLHAPHKERMQWLSLSQTQEITQDGAYTITPLEMPAGLKILKIRRRVTEFGGFPEWLHLSYRQPIGTYNTSMVPGLTRGASVHLVVDTSPALDVFMIDATPGSPDFYNDAALQDGGCFYDAGVLIRQLSHDPNGVAVSVSLNASDPGCVAAPPPPPPPPPPTGCKPIGKSGKCK